MSIGLQKEEKENMHDIQGVQKERQMYTNLQMNNQAVYQKM